MVLKINVLTPQEAAELVEQPFRTQREPGQPDPLRVEQGHCLAMRVVVLATAGGESVIKDLYGDIVGVCLQHVGDLAGAPL